ncbi:sugar ABC transporter permease [Arachnia propionica]|uniref:Sugar ABC transporter permease n=1 Tax=Arachnia propionica TaxID=1750 RepID=A0A3P1WWV8_9ACTN|nr:ABC transporter permease subunit [Arachnia propionica]RRD50217.1 sugar ABC transporter permease [Arachnia propionica]
MATRSRLQRAAKVRTMYVFIIPGLLFFTVFAYLPMLGNIVAFQDYRPFKGIAGSRFVGFDNFARIFTDPELFQALTNTLVIALLLLLFAFPAPILLALLINSLMSPRLKRFIQSVVYLPHFLSWVIVISIWQKIFGGSGALAHVLADLGVHGFNLMSDPDTFKFLVVAQSIWKSVGWGTIIYFAAISGIPQELYEAAAVDGAGSWKRTWHVTLPGIMPIVSLLLILEIGGILNVGFEQLLLQQPAVGKDAAQVLDTFVYFRGILGGDWGLSTAAGLLKGIVATVLIIAANRFAKRVGGSGVF